MHRDLVERAMAGDHDAVAELARVSIGRLFVVARLILRDEATAEDATQEALVAAWRHIHGLRDPERFEVWLHRLLINACYEEARRYRRWSQRIRELPVDGPGGPDPTVSIAERDALERAFLGLSPEHRAVFVLHHTVGLPLASIAEVVGVPTGTVKSRLHHATRNLRAALAADEPAAEARPA